MATPVFNDKPVITEDVTTWPKSPDRELISQGREKYRQPAIQDAFKSNPSQARNLSDYATFLQHYGLDDTGLYKQDPVADLIAIAAGKGIYFNDDNFPPSIWWDGVSGVKNHGRVKTLIPKMHNLDHPSLFYYRKSDSPDIIDINQGGLGDCGFVATIGCLALHPEAHNLLFSAIYPAVYNPLGIYSVRLLYNSEIRYLLIDDNIPHEGYSYMTHASEFWYLLIEKTFAKIRGGYSKLGGGMEKYMGIQSTSNTAITADNKDRVWNCQFLNTFQTNHSTTYEGTGYYPKYLIGGHAYSVIDAAEWSGTRLVRLHNPWNIANYHGPFSPGSSDWNKIPKVIQKDLFQVDRFGGLTFWMPYELYIEDMPKISEMNLDTKLPVCLKEIANPNPIQN